MHFTHCILTISLLSTAYAQNLDVDTTVGTVAGYIDPALPDVKQFLGIPFAEPPTNSLRFLPPVAKARSDRITANELPASCIQYESELSHPSIFGNATPEFLTPRPYSEDCLYLNVIAPNEPKGESLPVLVWFHGGMTTEGGINVPYEQPQKWVRRTQEHIVVQINYRLNIFGFPNAKGLNDNNLGILDQRLALEWVRDNIACFGGDPAQITAWGQSAGAATADAHQFAFAEDPIFRATILESNAVLFARTDSDANKSSFSYVAGHVGCNNTAAQVECMRGVDAMRIVNVIKEYTDRNSTPPLYFAPAADGRVAFKTEEYLQKGRSGDYADLPALLGSNSEEGSSFVPFSTQRIPSPQQIQEETLSTIQCTMATTSRYREASNRKSYRYLYAGNFTNISPVPWIGAYHFAEIPLLTGTYNDYRGEGPQVETDLSQKMQDLWLAFAKDPENGLDGSEWAPYSAGGNAIVFGRDGMVVSQQSIAELDKDCPANPPSPGASARRFV